jgi:hypothetical protein
LAPFAWSACSPNAFTCITSADCVNASGLQGVCVPGSGFCAYADPTCPTTLERYSVSAGGGVASACVPVDAGLVDAGFDPDAGVTAAACSACQPDQACAATTTPGDGGGTTYKCWAVPSTCAMEMTCGCAYELCINCGCNGVSEAGVVECLCQAK